MIDNAGRRRFEREEDGLLVWADYRAHDGRILLPHVEADAALQGKGAAGRLMQDIVEHARAKGLVLEPRCSYARYWFERHPEAQDVLD